jgi:hypothetical protein
MDIPKSNINPEKSEDNFAEISENEEIKIVEDGEFGIMELVPNIYGPPSDWENFDNIGIVEIDGTVLAGTPDTVKDSPIGCENVSLLENPDRR